MADSLTKGKVKGLDEVLANFDKVIDRTNENSRKGLQIGAAFLKGEAVKLTPIDEGDLRASAFYSTEQGVNGANMRVGYTAKYAEWVHEMPMKLKKESPVKTLVRPVKGLALVVVLVKAITGTVVKTSFYKKAVLNNAQRFLGIVARYMKL